MPSAITNQFITSVGGHIGVTPFQGNRTPEFGLLSEGASGAANYFALRNVQIRRTSFLDDTTQSDGFGGQETGTTGQGGEFQAECVYDPDNDLEYWLQNQSIQNINLGCRVQLLIGDGVSYPADTNAEFYYIPSCKIAFGERRQDAGNKKFVVQAVRGLVNGRMYIMPFESEQLALYINHLSLWNKVF